MIWDQWQSLNNREKIYVLTLGLFLMIAGFYQFFLHPLNTDIDNLKTELSAKKELLAWMQTSKRSLQSLRRQTSIAPQSSDSSVLSIVEITLNQGALQTYDKNVRQQSRGLVSVSFKEAPFIEILDWIANIWQNNRIQVSKLSIIRGKNPGIVKADIELQRS